jgi:hypothetical protein
MSDAQQKRRTSDNTIVGKLSDSAWLNIIHRFASIAAPVIAAIFIGMFNHYSDKLDQVYNLLTAKVGQYDQHFSTIDNQIGRLEDERDYTKGRP